jgi:hypothetical protein
MLVSTPSIKAAKALMRFLELSRGSARSACGYQSGCPQCLAQLCRRTLAEPQALTKRSTSTATGALPSATSDREPSKGRPGRRGGRLSETQTSPSSRRDEDLGLSAQTVSETESHGWSLSTGRNSNLEGQKKSRQNRHTPLNDGPWVSWGPSTQSEGLQTSGRARIPKHDSASGGPKHSAGTTPHQGAHQRQRQNPNTNATEQRDALQLRSGGSGNSTSNHEDVAQAVSGFYWDSPDEVQKPREAQPVHRDSRGVCSAPTSSTKLHIAPFPASPFLPLFAPNPPSLTSHATSTFAYHERVGEYVRLSMRAHTCSYVIASLLLSLF